MKATKPSEKSKPEMSKLRLALGAASLLLFIVGVKRSFRTEDRDVTEGDRKGGGEDADDGPHPPTADDWVAG